MGSVKCFTSFNKRNLCLSFGNWSFVLISRETCSLLSPLSQNKEPESLIKSPFNNSLLPVKKCGTNYQWYYVLMVTAVVEIWTAQLGAIRVRKRQTVSFPWVLLCFFLHERWEKKSVFYKSNLTVDNKHLLWIKTSRFVLSFSDRATTGHQDMQPVQQHSAMWDCTLLISFNVFSKVTL